MSYQIEIVNKQTLSHIKFVEVVNEPSIKEEINGEYSLNFEAHYEAKSILNASVLVKVNGQHYQIKKLTKSRGDSITLSVQCEHVSYELIIDGDFEEDFEIESTAEGMIRSTLSGTRFALGSCISTNFAYYRTKTRDKRQQLIDIANLFGGELYFDNFTFHLVHQRGSDKGLDIKLGVNLLGVTEEIDFVEGTTAYELDLVDLSRINGYKLDFSSAEIGDTISISDNVLGINTKERIIAIEYNPFKKQLPTVTVGQYMHDFTEYLKDEEEATLKTNESWLEVFSIGETNVLYLDDLDTGGATVEIDEKAPVVTLQVKQEHIGDTISVNLFDSSSFQYANYNEHAFDLNGRLIIDGDFPRGTKGAVEITVTDKKTAEQRVYFVNVEDTSADSFEDFWLESLLVGTEECINLDGLNISNGGEGADLFIDNKVATITIKVKAAYKDYIKAVSIYNDSNVIVHTRGSSHFDSNGQVIIKREFPMTDRGAIKIAIMHPETKVKQTFLVDVSMGLDIPIDQDYWLSEFRIGDVDCLSLLGVQMESANSANITAEVEYTKTNEFIGLFLSLKEAHKNATIIVTNQDGTSINYNNSTVLPNGNTAIIVTVTKGQEKQYYGVEFEQMTFEGLITIKSKLENGTIIGTREMSIESEGTYEITADEIDGYELISESPISVKITLEESEKIVEFIYRQIGEEGEAGKTGYSLEFGTTPISSNTQFIFTTEYDSVESVAFGLIGTGSPPYVNLIAEPLQNTTSGKYIGLSIKASPVVVGKEVSVQAVCFKEANG